MYSFFEKTSSHNDKRERSCLMMGEEDVTQHRSITLVHQLIAMANAKRVYIHVCCCCGGGGGGGGTCCTNSSVEKILCVRNFFFLFFFSFFFFIYGEHDDAARD